MFSLYHALLAHHSRQLTSVRCAPQTISQLLRYLEDVLLDNNLAALLVQSLPPAPERPLRDLARLRDLSRTALHSFFFVSPDDALNSLPLRLHEHDRAPTLLTQAPAKAREERFIVIADARFSAMLAALHSPHPTDSLEAPPGDEVIWSFEPDVVYSALEYLMARVTAERPFHAPQFAQAVHSSMPKATSLQLTVAVTTKLARLLQEQAGREIAVNRIATAIRSSLELPSILQTTVNEVGRALRVQSCVMRIEGEADGAPLTKCYAEPGAEAVEVQTAEVGAEEAGTQGSEVRLAGHFSDWYAYGRRLAARSQNYLLDGRSSGGLGAEQRPLAIVPMVYHERFVGALMVRSGDATRLWEETEVLLLRTVADQVAVAVNHARLFAQVQQQALTDALTGCFNRRSFEMQLEREVRIAMRQRQPLSVVLLDIDHFKRVNDTYGHDAGDAALRYVAGMLREELRGVDTAARYGGEEFVVVLPQAGVEGAAVVAERLRERLAGREVPGVGQITASFGVATYPLHGSGREEIVKAADRALYEAKAGGRNQVRVAESVEQEVTAEMFEKREKGHISEDEFGETTSMPGSQFPPTSTDL